LDIFNLILLDPILNILVVLSSVLFSSFGLAIIALTVIVRLIMMPLTVKQLQTSKKMTESMATIKPKLEQLKKKFAKNPQKLQQETMKLYKEAGISPLGCLSSPMILSLVIQMPIFIALYRAIVMAMAVTPQDFLGLSQHLYSWSMVTEALPVSGRFLWLDMASPDPYFVLPILVAASMWVSQKMITQPSTDPQQQSMSNMMQIMMPLMFAFITLTLPSGLGIYFVVSGVASIVIQYFIFGWGNLFTRAPAKEAVAPKAAKLDSGKTSSGPPLPYKNPQQPKVAGGLGQAARDLLGRFGMGGSPQPGPDESEKGKPSGGADQRSSSPEGSKYGKSGSKGKDR
jgi:YidC/Oxa1 family membrane protein insertase